MIDELDPDRRSALEAAASCLFHYQQVYILGNQTRSDESRRGTAFHEAARLYIGKLWSTKTTMDADLAREAFIEGLERVLLPARLVAETKRIYRRFAERFELKIDAYLHCEEKIVTTRRGRRFSWIPDLVYAEDRGVTIYDWKTHWVGWTVEQARLEFQARFYLFMAALQWPGQPRYVLRFVFVRIGLVVKVEFNQDDLREIAEEIEDVIAVIDEANRREEYPATAGPLCGFCRLACPIASNPSLAPIRVDTAESFAALASEYVAISRRRDLLREAMGGFCVSEGPQQVNGLTFRHWPIESSRFPVDAVLALAADHDLLVDHLSVSKSELGPLLNPKKYPTIAPELQKIGKKTIKFEFEGRKRGAIVLDELGEVG